MAAVLVYGFTVGDFAGEGSRLLSMPWGIVSLVDLYVGFILFSGWIVYREASLVRTITWIVAVMVLGFFAASLYALLALRSSSGDWRRFWLGKHAD
jgi:pilus assembly protein TadC